MEALSVYIHVPFCARRCGYCDFNTYVMGAGGTLDSYLRAAHREIDLAAESLGDKQIQTVFFGGGTPTMLAPSQLNELLAHITRVFRLAPNPEITTEANPETCDEQVLESLLAGGFNRLSLGMQSASAKVLAVLDRAHTPNKALEIARLAHRVGCENVSLDLIYGTPGETLDEWRGSLKAALSVNPEHISAYSLIVEGLTPLARRIRAGEINPVDQDDLADKYLLADDVLTCAGFENYETSNWARGREHQSRHNMTYWIGGDWWGIGPGAHSHIGRKRWWNVKNPRHYAELLERGLSPAAGEETLSDKQIHEEAVMLGMRLTRGVALSELTETERARLPGFQARGLVSIDERVRATLAGRLLADAIVRDLLD